MKLDVVLQVYMERVCILGQDKMVLICAVSRRNIANVKSLVMNIDKDAFIVVTNSREVLGHGFKKIEVE